MQNFISCAISLTAFLVFLHNHDCFCFGESQEIQERMPADPFEAELLMMAEAVAVAEKGSDDSSDESDTETSEFLLLFGVILCL